MKGVREMWEMHAMRGRNGLELARHRVASIAKRFVLLLLVAVAVACSGAPDAASPEHAVLEDLADLRSRFNADVGKVRAVFLASPT